MCGFRGTLRSVAMDILDELDWRGLIAESTDRDGIRSLLAAPPGRVYAGFDPTGPSLHLGHLVPLLVLARFQRAGHAPIALVGGGTAMIGDPRDVGERVLISAETVAGYVDRVRPQLERFLDFDAGPQSAIVANNADWLAPLSAIELLRDVGKHFPVGAMLAKETVRRRLQGDGISFTEFSYMLLQSYDFLHLARSLGCRIQVGGSDQWGNITAGVELIRRTGDGSAGAVVFPLITAADGTKFGKSQGASVWLDPGLTSPYAMYQYLVNTQDADVGRYLRYFTFLDAAEIDELDRATADRPEARVAQQRLARELTTLVHGTDECSHAVAIAQALFGAGPVRDLDPTRLVAALRDLPTVASDPSDTRSFAALLVAAGLASSLSDARRLVAGRGVYVNDDRVDDSEKAPGAGDFLGGRVLVLRRGRRQHALVTRGGA